MYQVFQYCSNFEIHLHQFTLQQTPKLTLKETLHLHSSSRHRRRTNSQPSPATISTPAAIAGNHLHSSRHRRSHRRQPSPLQPSLTQPSDETSSSSNHRRQPSQVVSPPTDAVSSLCFSPKANHLVATSWDNQVRCWEVTKNGTSVTTVAKTSMAHEQPVLCSSWKDDGTTVFSGGCDKQVKNEDLEKDECLELKNEDLEKERHMGT